MVVVLKGDTPDIMAYNAIKSVYKKDNDKKSVLLKVNTGFKGKPGIGLTTHKDTVKGLIKFFYDEGYEKIYCGDSSVMGVDNWEALEECGIKAVCEEMGATCVNLDEFPAITKDIPDGVIVSKLNFSSLYFDVDTVVSVPVMKTHMYTGATLSIKNMKGALHGFNKTILHRIATPSPNPDMGKPLDFGIAEMARVCYTDYCVIDGYVAMEGFGPSGGTPVDMGVMLASSDPIQADLIAVQLMGMKKNAVSHLNIVAKERNIDVDNIKVEPSNYMDYAKNFKPASEVELLDEYENINVIDKGGCSGCHATLITFLKVHGQKIDPDRTVNICIGKDLEKNDFADGENILIGNCTAKHRKDFTWGKGCPPIPSQVYEATKESKKKETQMKINFIGHSSFAITYKDYVIVTDPFITGNPVATITADDIKPTHILLTHAHGDHLGDTAQLAKANNSKVLTTVEVAETLDGLDLVPFNIGGNVDLGFANFKMTTAVHGSGVAGGLACGFIITLDDTKIYFAGDTALTVDMTLLEDENIDYALLPIGDMFTMGPKDACRAVKMIQPKNVIPMHYNTMPPLTQDPNEFKKMVETATDSKVIVLAPGETLEV